MRIIIIKKHHMNLVSFAAKHKVFCTGKRIFHLVGFSCLGGFTCLVDENEKKEKKKKIVQVIFDPKKRFRYFSLFIKRELM